MGDLSHRARHADLSITNAPSVFSGAFANIIEGGDFTNIGRDQVNHTNSVTIIQAPEPPSTDEANETLAMLRQYTTVKTWDFHQGVFGRRAPDTGEEFDASQDMEQWRETANGFFWATGGPGTGKTHLASYVFDRLHTRTKDDQDTVAVITYLRFSDDTTEWDIVMGLLIHLVESKPLPTVLETIKAGFAEHEQRNSRPTFDQLSQIFQTVVKKYKRCYIIIDGLDESRWKIQTILVELLAVLEANILLMSRVLPLIQDRLRQLRSTRPVFMTVAAHEKDLDRYITHVINTNPRLARLLKDPNVQTRLRNGVKKKAEGMFLHISLQMEALRDCLDVRSIFDVVNRFPSGMDALYLETLKRIDRQPLDHGLRARRALAWILYSHQPLRLADLLHAIAAFSPDYEIQEDRIIYEGDLVVICCGLIAVDEKTGRVRLVHETAQQYLGDLLKDQCPAPHEMMALTCMSLLERSGLVNSSISTTIEMDHAFAHTPLLEYAYRSLGHHIRKGLEEQPLLQHRVLEFIRLCQSFPYHHSLFNPTRPTTIQRLSPLHVATLLHLPDTVATVLKDKKLDVNARSHCSNRAGWSSLTVACAEGHVDMIPTLFSSPQLDGNDDSGGDLTPLMVASAQGNEPVISTLLKFNTRVGRLLANASKRVWASAVARFVDVNRANVAGETALMMASRNGHAAAAALLLAAPHSDPNLESRRGETAYTLALKYDRVAVVQLFLDALRFDINIWRHQGMTALMIASASGSHDVVKAILSIEDTDPNQPDNPPLILATRRDHVHVVQLLLATPGIDPNIRDADGDSALILAAQRGYTRVVEVLLADPAVDPNIRDKGGNTPLAIVLGKGHTDIAELLLRNPRINPNLRHADGDTPLLHASRRGQSYIVKLLLAFPGIDPNLCDRHGDSALTLAISQRNTNVVGLILAAPGTDVNLQRNDGNTPLIIALLNGFTEIAEVLLTAPEIDPNLCSDDGDSPLLVASNYGFTHIVRLLLGAPGIDPTQCNKNGLSPLNLATSNGRTNIVQLLTLALGAVEAKIPDRDEVRQRPPLRNHRPDAKLRSSSPAKHDSRPVPRRRPPRYEPPPPSGPEVILVRTRRPLPTPMQKTSTDNLISLLAPTSSTSVQVPHVPEGCLIEL